MNFVIVVKIAAFKKQDIQCHMQPKKWECDKGFQNYVDIPHVNENEKKTSERKQSKPNLKSNLVGI